MYIQLTERCNMTCEHCCVSATSKGDDMDRATYMQALMVAIRYGEHITLGGGEPTIHKEFFEYLDKAIEFYDCKSLELPPHVITNGKLKTKAMKLLDYVEEGRSLHIELSQDYYHDPIKPEVVARFRAHNKARENARWSYSGFENSSAGIRTVTRILDVGRAKELGIADEPFYEGQVQCCCETPFVDPRGMVWSCGCKIHQLGSIWHNDILDDYNSEYAHMGGREPIDEQLAA